VNSRKTPEFFDGEVLKWCEVPGLAIGEIRYPAGCRRPSHGHEHACFHFLLQGGYVEHQGSRSRESKTLSLSFQPSGLEHCYRSAGETVSRALTIELDDSWMARLQEHSITLDTPVNLRGGAASWLVMKLYDEFDSMQAGSSLVMEALALEIAVETSRRHKLFSERKAPVWLRQATDLLHERFAESLSLAQIASAAGVHPVHLARVFRQIHRCTVGEYLRRIRIEFACREMTRSRSTLAEIAQASGFSDQSRFSHTFKRIMGTTPARFRADSQAS
jgi:AraC family transcriptional regulator